MKYTRSFILHIGHFNGPSVYEKIDQAKTLADAGHYQAAYMRVIEHVLPNIHGHNFKIDVTIDGSLQDDGILADDDIIRRTVEEWNNTNLSVHKDFAGGRATTELMAKSLWQKLKILFPDCLPEVAIHETHEIVASYP